MFINEIHFDVLHLNSLFNWEMHLLLRQSWELIQEKSWELIQIWIRFELKNHSDSKYNSQTLYQLNGSLLVDRIKIFCLHYMLPTSSAHQIYIVNSEY